MQLVLNYVNGFIVNSSFQYKLIKNHSQLWTKLKVWRTKVEWPVNKHLSARGRPNPKGGFHFFWCPTLGASKALKIIKNELKMRKLQPLKVKGVKNSKKQITEHYKAGSQRPKKFFICCFVPIRVQRWFVKLKMALL
jgi:hypothetical protein